MHGGPVEKKMKYPKHLVPVRTMAPKFTEKGFYVWMTPKPFGKMAFLLALGILISIAFMLFSIWPLWLKIGIWYFSFYTLVILVNNLIGLTLYRWALLFLDF